MSSMLLSNNQNHFNMKKITLIIITAFAMSTFSFAQDFSTWQIGVLQQKNIDSRLTDYDGSLEPFQRFRLENKNDIKLGILLTRQFKHLFLETGINHYNRKSYLYESKGIGVISNDISTIHFMNTNYLNIPLNLGFRYPLSVGNIYTQVGGNYNLLLTGYYTYTEYNSNTTLLTEERPKSAFNQHLFGGQTYLGYQIPIFNRIILDFSISYYQDFTYFTNDTYSNYDFKNKALGFALRCKYNLE